MTTHNKRYKYHVLQGTANNKTVPFFIEITPNKKQKQLTEQLNQQTKHNSSKTFYNEREHASKNKGISLL